MNTLTNSCPGFCEKRDGTQPFPVVQGEDRRSSIPKSLSSVASFIGTVKAPYNCPSKVVNVRQIDPMITDQQSDFEALKQRFLWIEFKKRVVEIFEQRPGGVNELKQCFLRKEADKRAAEIDELKQRFLRKEADKRAAEIDEQQTRERNRIKQYTGPVSHIRPWKF